MAARRRRITPLQDARAHIQKAIDKMEELEIKFINPYKGTV